MKILHVSEAMGGGIQTALVSYVSAAPEYEHVVFARTRVGVPTLRLPKDTRMTSYVGGLVGFLRSALRVVERERPDIVHLHSSYAGALRFVLRPGTSIVYSPHCYSTERTSSRLKNLLFSRIETMAALRQQTVFAVSERERELAAALNPRAHIHTIPNVSLFPAQPTETSRRGSGKVVMSGRLTPQKDPVFFANVAEKLRSMGIKFIWIGDGEPALRSSLAQAGIHVTGWISPEEIQTLLSESDLYLHTAAWEGAPLSTLEAANSGCPVLARTIPSMQALGYATAGIGENEVAHNVRRFFRDSNYVKQVCQATESVSTMSSLPHLRARLIDGYQNAALLDSRRRPVLV